MTTGNPSKAITITTWVLSGLLALAFLGAGGSKLAGLPMHVENFARWGYPAWFLDVTGAIEIIGAVLVLVPRLAGVGGVLLCGTMVGAALTHVRAGEVGMLAAPLVLLVAAATVTWLRRGTLLALVRRDAPVTA